MQIYYLNLKNKYKKKYLFKIKLKILLKKLNNIKNIKIEYLKLEIKIIYQKIIIKIILKFLAYYNKK